MRACLLNGFPWAHALIGRPEASVRLVPTVSLLVIKYAPNALMARRRSLTRSHHSPAVRVSKRKQDTVSTPVAEADAHRISRLSEADKKYRLDLHGPVDGDY